MKTFYLFTFFIFSTTFFSQNKAAHEIDAIMKEQEVAWNNADLEGFMKYYWNSDSLKFIGSKGITYGWQKTLDNYKKSYPNKEAMGTLVFEISSRDILSKEAVFVIGKWTLMKKDKNAGGYFSLLWKKIKGEWLIVVDHTS